MTHEMMMLVFQLGIIIFLAKLGNRIFEKIHIPGLIGELVVGIIIGPYLLGSLSLPGFPDGIFPLGHNFPVSTELYGISTIASIILLFISGVETDLNLFIRYSVVGGFVGVGGIIFSFLFGMLVALFFSSPLLGKSMGFFSPQTLFLGAMATATSVGITARILSEKKKMESPEGVTILAGAVIDDVGGIIVLAIILGIVGSNTDNGGLNWGKIGIIAAKSFGIWLAATAIGILASHRISGLLKLFKTKTTIAIMSLGLALIVAGFFEEAGLAMIIGAYVTGLSLSNTDIKNLINEILHPLYEFFVPIFFCVMGMLIDVRTFASPKVILFALIYTIAESLAKILGCGLPSLAFNFNLKGAYRIGAGMIPRGEVALIIAGIGISAGFIQQDVFGVAVFMTLVTTLVAPSFLISAMNIKGSGTKKESKIEQIDSYVCSFKSNELAELMLQNTIELFDEEGFFVSTLNPQDNIYQLRKDRYVITVSLNGQDLIFHYRKTDEGIVLGSLVDVFAKVEKMLQGLKEPINKNEAIKALFEQKEEERTPPIDPKYFNINYIIPDLKSKTKEGVIQDLLSILVEDNTKIDFSYAFKELMKRENEMSTGLQDGVAIPHTKIEGIDKIICAVGISKSGIDFNSLDGKPSHIFFLILSPIAGTNRLELLSQIAKKMTEKNRRKLLNAKSAEEIYEILTTEG